MSKVYDFSAKLNSGLEQPMSAYRNNVLLIVNTASKCGFTSQYEGLESLYNEYKNRGFTLLAFPCNQFGAQEPANNEKIASFCNTKFNISFPLFEKINVNGNTTIPLFHYLKSQAPGALGSLSIKWNFTKFLVSKKGNVIKRFAPTTTPQKLKNDIEKALVE